MAHDAPSFGDIQVDRAWRIGIVRSTWHDELTSALRDSAIALLTEKGIDPKRIIAVDAPGSFELPLVARGLIVHRNVHAVIACGIVIDGATHHADLVAQSATQALMDLQMNHGVPVAHALLHVKNIDDAKARAKGEASRGREAALAVLHALAQLNNLQREIS